MNYNLKNQLSGNTKLLLKVSGVIALIILIVFYFYLVFSYVLI